MYTTRKSREPSISQTPSISQWLRSFPATSKALRELISEGLFFYDNSLYESAGLYNSSRLLKYKPLSSGSRLQIDSWANLDPNSFGEGAAFSIENGGVFFYQLTYKERYIAKYDERLRQVGSMTMPAAIREGWGMTRDPRQSSLFYISDGTQFIYQVDFSKLPLAVKSQKEVGSSDFE